MYAALITLIEEDYNKRITSFSMILEYFLMQIVGLNLKSTRLTRLCALMTEFSGVSPRRRKPVYYTSKRYVDCLAFMWQLC